jgi:tetratricopeptide (TPR) repeat protein
MTRVLRGLAALTLFAAAPVAAQDPIAARMINLQGTERPANERACRLTGGGPDVVGAATRFQTAMASGAIQANKIRMLTEGRDLTLKALQGAHATSSKAWYFYARTSFQLGDLAAGDSAFTRLLALAPACAEDARLYRVRAWSMMISAAAASRTAGQADSAAFFARAANRVDPTRPQGFYTLAIIAQEANQPDSSIAYFRQAVAADGDTTTNALDIRQASAFQYAVLAFNARNYPLAVQGFSDALRLKSDDNDARRNLAASLRQAGMADSAAKVEAGMIAAAAGSEGGLTVAQLFDIGVAQFNQQDYANAALTFEKIVLVEPVNRDALFNLANSYLGVRNGDKLLETALKLQAIDPLSNEILRLVANGYSMKQDRPNTMRAATVLSEATISVAVTAMNVTATGASMTIRATGREGRDANDRIVRGAPIPIVVEFLDKTGTVVTTAETTIPALANGATEDLTVTGTGANIGAWRYRRK